MVALGALSAAVGLAAAVFVSPADEDESLSTGTAMPNAPAPVTAPAMTQPVLDAREMAAQTTAGITLAGEPVPTTTTDPNAPRSLTVLLTGDILAENPVLDAGRRGGEAAGSRFDFTALLAPITPLVSSFDLAVCQMEVPVGRPDEEPGAKGRSPHGGNRLLNPYEFAPNLRDAGFDRCTTASNHSYDVGDAGIDPTIDALEGVGISWSGTARRPEELPPPVFEVNGVRIAHLSYTRYSNTDLPAADWRLAYTENPARIAREVTEARDAGAELVIVSIHLSKELLEEPLEETRLFAASIIASSNVDAIVHHGPHVVQGFEVVDGTPVWWSIGNLLTGMARPNASDRYTDPRTRDGLGAGLRFTETAPGVWDTEASSIVLCNESASRVIHAGVTAATDPALDQTIRDELEGCVERTRAAVPDAG